MPTQHNRSRSESLESNSLQPESEKSVVPIRSELLDLPSRKHIPTLSPKQEGKHIWFRHDTTGKITKQILKMLKSDLPKPYPTYRSLPQEIKNRWFRAFAQEFNWDSNITEYVRTNYAKQADLSFRSNLREWKKLWKHRGPENLPEWMKAKKSLFDGYIKMWTDEKAVKTAAKNSKNRSSDRGGLGIAIHNNGAKTYERRWDEMTTELGKEPNMIYFMEETHLNKKTRIITDMKTKKILEIAKSKLELTNSHCQTEGDNSTQPKAATQEDINSIMLEVVPKVKGGRYGFGKFLNEECSSSTSTPRHIPDLREEIQILKKHELEKNAQIKYLMECNKLLFEQFPQLRPPEHPSTPSIDEDEMQA
ncbi:uncharacterized protein LOC111828587 [Capsella rubella]|uniref:uncharacterized protein LOC111828587 n=1 Tax=Capsella rubella TaxID=81985 RepID=UPI000CD4F12F|nr:uncharacterized protein LOC111828587 [Capsella rubella]